MTKLISNTVSSTVTLSASNGYGVTIGGAVEAGSGEIGITGSDGGQIYNYGLISGGSGMSYSTVSGGAGGAGVSVAGHVGLYNSGTITGGDGGSSTYASGNNGGAGVSLIATSRVANNEQGTISGGNGGSGGSGSNISGSGAAGVSMDSGTLFNAGTIRGGSGGGVAHAATANDGGAGGIGVALSFGTMTNYGNITGGAGGYGTLGAGSGGEGVSLVASTLTNVRTIKGGAGGAGGGDDGGAGGAGIIVSGAGAITNHGRVIGGAGGTGGPGASGGSGGVGVSLGGGTMTNYGSIAGGNGGYHSGNGGAGVKLDGGTLSNVGTITGGNGSYAASNNGGFGGAGVYLYGGSLTNNGVIKAGNGGFGDFSGGGGGKGINVDGGTVTNDGTIAGGNSSYGRSGLGVYLQGGAGVYLQGGTLITSGTISGGAGGAGNAGNAAAGDAVQFSGGIAGTLVVDPGAVFNGLVVGSTQVGDVLELAAGNGGPAMLDGAIGTEFSNFATLAFDAGAHWTVEGTAAGLAAISDITGDGTGTTDTIVIDNFVENGFTYANGELVLSSAGGSEILHIQGDYTQNSFGVTTDGTNTTVDVLCFLRGTRILTPSGEVPVEELRIGDAVSTLGRGAQPIRWIGTGRVMVPAGHRSPATPVIVRRDALGPGVPHRDLRITKGHALFVDRAFFPAEFLVNHRSIVWDDAAKEVDFYHIELDTHEVLLAEGAPAESYRDEGNRWLFRNANPAWDRPGVPACAPVLTGGAQLDAVWARLLARCGARLDVPTTTDPDLHLLVDGARVEAVRQDGGVFEFPLPAYAISVTIASRAAAQDELGRCRDPRRLGVAIARIEMCCGGAGRLVVGAHALNGPGFHGYEAAEDCIWTNGSACLPEQLLDVGAQMLRIHLRHTTHYALQEVPFRRAVVRRS